MDQYTGPLNRARAIPPADVDVYAENERLRRTVHGQAREIAELKRQLSTVMGHPHTPKER